MRKAAALAVAGLVLAGCSSTVQGVGSPAGPDGSQTYAGVKDLYDDVVEGGTSCDDFQQESDPGLASDQASCTLGGGKELVLLLWQDAGARDDGLSRLQDTFTEYDLDYCFVVGRGDSGTWTVNAGDDPGVCQDIGADLGGEIQKSGSAQPPTG